MRTQFWIVFDGGGLRTKPETVNVAGIGGGCLVVENVSCEPTSVWVQNGGSGPTVMLVSPGGSASLMLIGTQNGQSIDCGFTVAVITYVTCRPTGVCLTLPLF